MWRNVCHASLLVLVVYVAATVAGYISAVDETARSSHGPIGGDFIAFYTAGAQVLHGQFSHVYDPEQVRALQQTETAGRLPELYVPFRNLPFFAVLVAPLALVDGVSGFIAWTVFSAALLALAIKLGIDAVPSLRTRWRLAALVAISFAPVYYGLVDGQNATLSLLLYALVYRAFAGGREGEAGAWAAVGIYKPQLFFVLPVVFLVARRWTALRTYACVSLALVALSAVLVGPDGVVAWWRVIVDFEPDNAATYMDRMFSVKALWDLLSPNQSQATLVMTVLTVIGLLAVLLRTWTLGQAPHRSIGLRWSVTVAIAVLVNPHILDYDLTLLLLPGLLLVTTQPLTRWWALAMYVVALVDAPLVIGSMKLQVATLLLLTLVLHLWWTLERSDAASLGDHDSVSIRVFPDRSELYAA
jgi:hypothetical protein